MPICPHHPFRLMLAAIQPHFRLPSEIGLINPHWINSTPQLTNLRCADLSVNRDGSLLYFQEVAIMLRKNGLLGLLVLFALLPAVSSLGVAFAQQTQPTPQPTIQPA